MLPFQNAFSAFLLIFSMLPFAVRAFIVVSLVFFIAFGALKVFLESL